MPRDNRGESVETIGQALGRQPHSQAVLDTLMAQAQGYLLDNLAEAARAPRLSLLHFASEDAACEGLRSRAGDLPVDVFIVDQAHRPRSRPMIRSMRSSRPAPVKAGTSV